MTSILHPPLSPFFPSSLGLCETAKLLLSMENLQSVLHWESFALPPSLASLQILPTDTGFNTNSPPYYLHQSQREVEAPEIQREDESLRELREKHSRDRREDELRHEQQQSRKHREDETPLKRRADEEPRNSNGNEGSKKELGKVEAKRRRAEMKDLFSALTSLVPKERLHEKHSLIERLDETLQYISWLREQIKAREQQIQLLRYNFEASAGSDMPCVKVRLMNEKGLFQVKVDGAPRDVLVSRVIEIVEDCGASVVDVSATTMENSLLFITLQWQVLDRSKGVDCERLCRSVYRLLMTEKRSRS